jgi:hypothetical protein
MEKGVKWNDVLDAELEGTDYGIVFLTPDNLKSIWIHLEVGALAKMREARIWTFLHGVNPHDVPMTLSKYQYTRAEKEDIFEMLKSINGTLEKVKESPLNSEVLGDNFEKHWSELEEKMRAAYNLRQGRAVVETAGESRADVFENSWLPPRGVDSYVRITTRGVPIPFEFQAEIFAAISNNYPNISLSGDTLGSTSGFNLFFKEPTNISSIPDIVSLIEKMTGISDIEAKIMRVVTRFQT